jgi:hypothetical protein
MADTLAAFEKAVLDFGKSYGLGTPESRAVITAVEHARAALNTEPARSEADVLAKLDGVLAKNRS